MVRDTSQGLAISIKSTTVNGRVSCQQTKSRGKGGAEHGLRVLCLFAH